MKQNLLMIVVDSLRYDKCIGDKKLSAIPNLEKLINDGIFFSQAISTASKTVPSLSSIFTGIYPFESTIVEQDFFKLNPNLPTFCDDLKNNSYDCHSILPEILKETNIPKLFSDTNFFNSFSTLYDQGLGEKILKKLDDSMNSPWFLYIHLVDLHGNALFNLDSNDETKIQNFEGKNQYEKMLSAMDVWFGKIFKKINSEETLTIVAADHGSSSADFTNEMLDFSLETDSIKKSNRPNSNIAKIISKKFPKKLQPLKKELGKIRTERSDKITEKKLKLRIMEIDKMDITDYQKRILKKATLYPTDCFDENFRPALVISGNTVPSNKIVTNQISLIDIFPTIFEILDIKTNVKHRGKSLVSYFSKPNIENDTYVMIDGVSSKMQKDYSDSIGIRTENYKYFRDRIDKTKNIHLYDLKKDPLELKNISNNFPEIVLKMENHLKSINGKKDFIFKNLQDSKNDETDNAKELLKELGYI